MEGQRNEVARFIDSRIGQLYANNNASAVRAVFAKMRRGVGKSPGESPDTWEITLSGLPEELLGKGSEPSRGEWAAHIALTLFSLHQQGKNTQNDKMHRSGETLGKAIRNLVKTDGDFDRIKRRFDQIITAGSLEEISHYLRSAVQLLKAEGIPLDYVLLGKQLFFYQFSNQRDGVRLAWGREFYRPQGTESSLIEINEAMKE